jgi:hypothetical protein
MPYQAHHLGWVWLAAGQITHINSSTTRKILNAFLMTCHPPSAAWHALRTRYGVSPENIILYGQSIGTVPTVDLASRYEVNALYRVQPTTL